jgi:hypothetical protein
MDCEGRYIEFYIEVPKEEKKRCKKVKIIFDGPRGRCPARSCPLLEAVVASEASLGR